MEILIVPASVPLHRWPTTEAASSAASSASYYELIEHLGIIAVVETEENSARYSGRYFYDTRQG
jgi:hypothetical protein